MSDAIVTTSFMCIFNNYSLTEDIIFVFNLFSFSKVYNLTQGRNMLYIASNSSHTVVTNFE